MGIRRINMLLAMDDEADRRWIRRYLTEHLDIDIRDVRDLHALRRAVGKTAFDCILVSSGLSDASPRALVRSAFGSPVIIWSHRPNPTLARLALADGAEDFLVAAETDAPRLLQAVRFAAYRHEGRLLDRAPVTPHGSLEQLASNVAHGINNPATFISHNLGFLRDAVENCGRLVAELDRLAGAGSVCGTELRNVLQRHQADQLGGELSTVVQEAEHGMARIIALVKDLQSLGNAQIGEPSTEPAPWLRSPDLEARM